MKKNNHKKILIVTGIYPPDIGGPSEYAFNLEQEWRRKEFDVDVRTFCFEKRLPTLFRHVFFFFKILPKVFKADFILALDTFSVALPTSLACVIFGKKITIRTGGDFLWESYVERTKKKILFRNFYDTEIFNFTFKEKIIFKITKWILNKSDTVVFSTNFQRGIWQKVYHFNLTKTKIIENYYGDKIPSFNSKDLVFVASSRNLVWKNKDMLYKVFENIRKNIKEIELFDKNLSHDDFLEKIKHSHAVILISLGDISPNMILDALRLDKPFVCTQECGLYDRLKDVGIWVDPLNKTDIEEKISWLCKDDNYKIQKSKIEKFNFNHSWKEIAEELF